jgi:NAD(P)-dependent dehydrogenase (short-subunit alcohol dehydrogenase family)
MEIKDKVALVTGAGSGIGHAISEKFAEQGVRALAMVDRTDAVTEAAEKINQSAGRELAIAFQGDTTDQAFRHQVFEDMMRQHGLVQICVPAAGITRDALAVKVDRNTKKAEIYSIDRFRLVVEVNLLAPIYWVMEMIARIAEDRSAQGLKKWNPSEGVQASAVFIGSISSQGNKGQISYASTKAGLEGAAATLTKEAIFHGVRCCVIHPGFTDTPMVQALGNEYIEEHILPDTQLGRLIRPQEIADAICFMVSNSSVSGELWADAGWHPSPM